MRIRDRVFGCFLLVVCFLLYNETKEFPVPGHFKSSPPALWPRMVLTLLAALSLALIIISVREHLKEPKGEKAQGHKIDFRAIFASINKRVVAAIAVTLVFLFTFRPAGFVISCFVYFIVLTMILEPTKKIKTILYRVAQAAALIVFIYFVFCKGLRVQLPPGPFPEQWFM